METSTDEELIKKIKEDNCSESLQILVERHAGIFYTMASRYAHAKSTCSGVSMQDFQDNRYFIVYQAVKDFDPNRGTKFVTWLGNKVRYFCLNTIEAEEKYYTPDPEKFSFMLDRQEVSKDNDNIFKESEYILNILKQIKDDRIRKIVRLRYFSEKKHNRSFNYIAKKLGMSTQGVIDLHNNFVNFVRRKLNATVNMDNI